MNFRLDLHLHTEYSPDSRTTLTQAVVQAKKKGISALAICDHNRCAPQEVFDNPLRDDVLLIPAVEYSTEIGHLLGLFLEKPCHVQGEETGRVQFYDAVTAIRQAGGKCVLAHPFELTHRSVAQISQTIADHEKDLDGIEIFNQRATKKRKNANDLAKKAAQALKKPLLCTAGSDAHTVKEIGGAWVEVEAEELTCAALCQALYAPLDYGCGNCPHLAFARSRFIRLRKNKAGIAAYVRWLPYGAICLLRSVKSRF